MVRSSNTYEISELREQLALAFPRGLIEADHTETEHWYKNTRTGVRAASVTTKQSVVGKGYLKQWAVNRAVEHAIQNVARINNGDSSVFDEARRAHTNELETAGNIGTKAHGAFDLFCQHWIETGERWGETAQFLKEGARGEEIAACRSFDKFKAEVEFVPIASELKIWYEKGGDVFAGTVDSVLAVREPYKELVGDTRCNHDYAPQRPPILWCTRCGRTVKQKVVLGDWKTSNQINNKDEYAEQTVAYERAIALKLGSKFIQDIWVVRLSKERAEYEIMRVSDRAGAWKRYLATSRLFDTRMNIPGPLLEPLQKKLIITI